MESQAFEKVAVSLAEYDYSHNWQETYNAKTLQCGVHDQDLDLLASIGHAV